MARVPNGPNESDYFLRAVPTPLWRRAKARAREDGRRGLREVLLELVELYVAGKVRLPKNGK